MKRDDAKWIFFSFFYTQKCKSQLLFELIAPFVNEPEQHYLDSAIIHFGTKQGDYMGLSCKVVTTRKKNFLMLFEKHFEKLSPSQKEQNTTSFSETLYMDFPPNTVWHNLHDFLPSIGRKFDAAYRSVWQQSSLHLLKTFKGQSFDSEDLFTAALHLNLLMLLTNENFGQDYQKKFSNVIKTNRYNRADFRNRYKQNEELLTDILNDCGDIVEGKERMELIDIRDWFKSFNLLIKNFDTMPDLKTIKANVFWSIFLTIREQLGMSRDGYLLMDYFIFYLLKNRRDGALNLHLMSK